MLIGHVQPSDAITQAPANPFLCELHTMSRIGQRPLTHEETSVLLQCGSFWPDSMVDKVAFLEMLLHVLNVEAGTDYQIARWEEELTASGACNASGVVDVKHFVAFCQQGGIEGTERPET
eukprot:4372658-Amphidinium_carterae.1